MTIKKITKIFGDYTLSYRIKQLNRMYWFQLPKETYSFYKSNNFGDTIGPYLYYKFRKTEPVYVDIRNSPTDKLSFLTVGSILEFATQNSIVWGSGIISKEAVFTQPRKILAVRGQLTYKRAKELGYDLPEIFGDPGLLLPRVFKPKIDKKYSLGIVPHYVDYAEINNLYNRIQDILIINPLDDLENIVRKILSCRFVISSSLHGIILAHAYNIPVAWVTFSDKLKGDGTKFLDHYSSVGIQDNVSPYNLNGKKLHIRALQNIAKSAPQPDYPIPIDKLYDSCPFRKI